MHLENYGLTKGCSGDLVILQALDPIEALRLKPARLFVIKRGKIISTENPKVSNLKLGEEKFEIDFTQKDFSWRQK